MSIPIRLATLLLALSQIGFSRSKIENKIDDLLQSTAWLTQAQLGYSVLDLAHGSIVASHDASKLLAPASNTKLYTTAAALVRLGPNYKFTTQVRTRGTWKLGEAYLDDLELIGGGDPNLSGRVLPYAPGARFRDPLQALRQLADQLYAAGIRGIRGDVTGVCARYRGESIPDGWTLDDTFYYYGAPVTDLAINDNAVTLTIAPAQVQELADTQLFPPIDHFVVNNQVVTTDSDLSDVHATRVSGSNEIIVHGTIGVRAKAWEEEVAIDDPPLFAAEALAQVLRERGVSILGSPRAESINLAFPVASDPGTQLTTYESGPLWQAVQVVNKISQNLHAEMLLRELGKVVRGDGTLQAGLDARDAFLKEIDIPQVGSALEDGSGLARQDLTTPESTARLLAYMWTRPERDLWLQSLPIGAKDGSLRERFKNIAGAERVHAKTGSYEHVNTLSGYIESTPGHWLAFSVMVNGTVVPDSDVHDFLDRFCALFLQ